MRARKALPNSSVLFRSVLFLPSFLPPFIHSLLHQPCYVLFASADSGSVCLPRGQVHTHIHIHTHTYIHTYMRTLECIYPNERTSLIGHRTGLHLHWTADCCFFFFSGTAGGHGFSLGCRGREGGVLIVGLDGGGGWVGGATKTTCGEKKKKSVMCRK